MIVNNHKNVAYEFEHFLTELESETLLDIAKKAGNWNATEHDFWKNRMSDISNHPEAKEILTSIKFRIQDLFTSFDKINEIYTISRFFAGDNMPPHQDKMGHPDIKFGIIVYLNDDYFGGELSYPEHDIKIKPKVGSLMMHPGDVLHEVTKVSDGSRYFMTTFVHGTETQPAILKELKIYD